MPEYMIEVLWTCSGCKEASNRGLSRRCHNCGKPKGPEDTERFPENIGPGAALTGDADRLARSGPDWKCAYCGTLQPKLGKCCTNCGVNQESGVEPWKHNAQSAQADGTGQKIEAPRPARSSVSPHSSPYVARPERVWREEPTTTPPRPRPFPWRGVGIAGGVALLGLLVWWLFTPRIVDAEVISVHWEHRVIIDRYQLNPESGWRPPSDAIDVRQEGTRVHHYDHVKVGSHTESYPEQYACGQDCQTIPGSCSTSPVTCTSNGNGTASCSGGYQTCSPPSQSCSTRYCTRTATRIVDDYEDQPRYAPWFTWKEWGWKYNRTVTKSGRDFETFWPKEAELAPGALSPGERERQNRETRYTTTFRDSEGEKYELTSKTLTQFEALPIGKKSRLKIRRVGTVELLPQ
jgi:hypothetical protein